MIRTVSLSLSLISFIIFRLLATALRLRTACERDRELGGAARARQWEKKADVSRKKSAVENCGKQRSSSSSNFSLIFIVIMFRFLLSKAG